MKTNVRYNCAKKYTSVLVVGRPRCSLERAFLCKEERGPLPPTTVLALSKSLTAYLC